MAKQKSKTTSKGKASSTGAKRGRPPGSKNKKTTTKNTSSKQPQKTTIRREAWAILYGFIAVITTLALMSLDGAVLKWYYLLLSGTIGAGAYLVPFALLGICILFVIRPKGPIRLRTTSIFAIPVLVGSISHCMLIGNQMSFSLKVFGELYRTGIEIESGGIISGLISMLLSAAFSPFGGILILILLMITCLLTAFHLTPLALWEMIQPPEYDYEDDEEEERYHAPNPVVEVAKQKKLEKQRTLKDIKSQIDLPIDDNTAFIEKKKSKKIISPAEYLESLKNKSKEIEHEQVEDLEPVAPLPVTPDPPPVEAMSKEEELEVPPFDEDISVSIPIKKPDFASLVQTAEPIPQAEPMEADPIKPEVTPTTETAKETTSNVDSEKVSKVLDESQKAPAPVYEYPPLSLLKQGSSSAQDATVELQESSQRLIDTLQSFNVDAQIINIVRGPSVTRFEITISRGIKFSRITSLSDDIALSLGAASVRIAPIPDKLAIGIEVPNKAVQMVYIREVIGSKNFHKSESKLTFAIGKDITGAAVCGDIAKMPHMLIAGTTGSGKSVCINSLLISVLYKSTPEEVRLIMIDPKMIELGIYNGIPHLLIPVVTDPKKASGALNWAVGEMMRRYKLFSEQGARDLVSYNTIMRNKKDAGEEGEWNVLPQIVIVIDELADLMMVAANEVEDAICRIAQMARAAGMHLVIATQRPSADVITGIMKANIPSRIAFAVASQIESRIILDQTGAEKLIGKGDMLYNPLGVSKPTRVQGCFIASSEVEQVVEFVKKSAIPDYSEEVMEHIEKVADGSSSGGSGVSASSGNDDDEMLPRAIEVVVESGQASVSMLQRRLKLGYSRAARLVDEMEERGIVGPFEGSKPRQVLISKSDWQEMALRQMD